LAFSIFANLGILGFFKYFNFFAASFRDFLNLFGFNVHPSLLNIILPVGISFYTFQSMSYTIDVYRKQLKPVKNLLDFALYVTYFPQLVAGPIERGTHLLPQVIQPRILNREKFFEGCYLIFWGLFLKIFIADNLAKIVEPVFSAHPPYNGFAVLIAVYAFAFQIYGDFAGYSSIARGLGKCMGFEIMVNFNLPYFARNPTDFWRRWHISLSTWLRDYLYIPLGGNRKGRFNTYRNLGLTMFLGGLWHGANWTFVAWGAYHGLLLMAHKLFNELFKWRFSFNSDLPRKCWLIIRILFFFHVVCFGWLLFRAQSLAQVYEMTKAIFLNFNFTSGFGLKTLISSVWLLLFIEFFCYKRNNLKALFEFPVWVRSVIYVILYFSLLIYGARDGREFIYFQF
ncbi:MAG: MBOAT family protein, partial [Candidatus Omnitrophica bacterium]|nr:MBOAT family protein [Candidatus Omnitrophota bacterium]